MSCTWIPPPLERRGCCAKVEAPHAACLAAELHLHAVWSGEHITPIPTCSVATFGNRDGELERCLAGVMRAHFLLSSSIIFRIDTAHVFTGC
jgi:hypothetical protein